MQEKGRAGRGPFSVHHTDTVRCSTSCTPSGRSAFDGLENSSNGYPGRGPHSRSRSNDACRTDDRIEADVTMVRGPGMSCGLPGHAQPGLSGVRPVPRRPPDGRTDQGRPERDRSAPGVSDAQIRSMMRSVDVADAHNRPSASMSLASANAARLPKESRRPSARTRPLRSLSGR